MSAAGDREIVEFALGKNAVVVTLDADFHAMLAVSGALWKSPNVRRRVVVWLTGHRQIAEDNLVTGSRSATPGEASGRSAYLVPNPKTSLNRTCGQCRVPLLTRLLPLTLPPHQRYR